MNRTLQKFKKSAFRRFIMKNKKYAPVLFFIGGFTFDSLTLGRIDRLYDMVVVSLHITSLSITLYLYNLADDGKWKNTLLDRYKKYFPLAIQFFFGALSSAYVIYFSRSVSLSKTITFFVILVGLLVANEFLKKRISNKYLQFSVYFFVSFTFFTFMIPVFIKEMNTAIFVISGLISLACTLGLIIIIYNKSPSTRKEIRLSKIIGLIITMYTTINLFYYFNLIPPVPLVLASGIVAHDIKVDNDKYIVSFETDEWNVFWREHRIKFIYSEGERVYVFASIFAPTAIEKSIFHRWKWRNENTKKWEIVDDIGYTITGGRGTGFRGYTYKNNMKEGRWKVEVITKEGLVIGIIDFEIVIDDSLKPVGLVVKEF
jgi:hypothetical protein